MIMEYIEGGELFDYIVEHSPLPLSEVVDYFQQIVFAISHFHSRTIAHRDLKPENILIDSNYNIKVADFGMATWDSHPDLLKTSCGSPHYASPEIINGDRYEGKLSDVWSCGIILHALLVGSLPFNHKDVPILLQKIKKAEFEMPEDICDEAKDLLRRMLEKDPRQRIVIAEIIQHPFFMMFPPRLDKRFRESEFTAPPSPIVELDPEIFGNLRDLRPDLSERQLLKALVFEG
jgi:serine/threonine-protein kinase HSL1, negative regulator of Swe1 kinase